MMTAPYMTTAQFIVLGSTGVESGQKAKNQIGVRKRSEMMLIANPYRPRDHRRFGNGAPLRRRHTRQAIEI